MTTRRNERLAQRNPERIRTQIDDLKAVTAGGGKLTRHEEQVLEGLEKELKAVTRARESLGDKAPAFRTRSGDGGGVLGKRRRDGDGGGDGGSSSESDVPDDVRRIPMPRDTPPPIPKEVLDRWYAKRRAARSANANLEPLGEGRRRFGGGEDGGGEEVKAAAAAPVEAKTVYEAKPVVRDLRKEAVSAFVPTAVRMKIDKGKGKGGLLEPEEADRLEREGYLRTGTEGGAAAAAGSGSGSRSRNVVMEDVEDEDG